MSQNMIARYTLLAIMVSLSYLWLVKILPYAYFFDEVCNWVVFAGLFYLLTSSSPDWLRQDLQKLFGRAKPKSAGA
jgi:hypothetical protein